MFCQDCWFGHVDSFLWFYVWFQRMAWYGKECIRYLRSSSFLEWWDFFTANDSVSYSIKCSLFIELCDGTLAYLSDEMYNGRNFINFLQGIHLTSDVKADHRYREFKQWLDLVTHTLDRPENCYDFIDKFSLSIFSFEGGEFCCG